MQKKEMPYCFQRQINKRLIVGTVYIILCLIMFCNIHNEKMFMSAVLIGIIILSDIVYLYLTAVKGEYIRLQGVCLKTEKTGFRKQTRYIYMKIEQGVLRIPAKENAVDIAPGDTITVYMGLRTIVYQQSDMYIINNYYVMDHSKKSPVQ